MSKPTEKTDVKKQHKARRLVAAEYKHKLAIENLQAAQREWDAAFRSAGEINWDTPYGESIKRQAKESEIEKALTAARRALKRASHALFIAGGIVK